MKKSLFTLLALLLVASMLLAACGEPTEEPVTAPEATEAAPEATEAAPEPTVAEMPAEATITIWHQWSGDYLTAIEQAFADSRHTDLAPQRADPTAAGKAPHLGIGAEIADQDHLVDAACHGRSLLARESCHWPHISGAGCHRPDAWLTGG